MHSRIATEGTHSSVVTSLVSKNDPRNTRKTGRAHYPSICTGIAIILKERNREMCGIQTLLSLVLFTSRVQKQVASRYIHVYIVGVLNE